MKTKLALAISAALLSSTAHSENNQSVNSSLSSLSKTSVTKMSNQNIKPLEDHHNDKGEITFQWAKKGVTKPNVSALKADIQTSAAADFYLNKLTGFSSEKDSQLRPVLSSMHTAKSGPTVATYAQELNGIEVFNKKFSILMDKSYNLVASSGSMSASTAAVGTSLKGFTESFSNPISAVKTAAKAVGVENINLTSTESIGKYSMFVADELNTNKKVIGTPRTKKVYIELNNKLVKAHYVELEVASKNSVDSDYYSFVVSSSDNKILFKNNMTAKDSDFNYRVYANESGAPWDSPHGNVIPATSSDQIDSSEYLSAPLVNLAHGPISTQDPWLAEDATTTFGNNVSAYVDAIAPDGFSAGDFAATTNSDKTFDYAYNVDERENSINNRNAAIVNLFYLNNYLHDQFYDHGFDESSGNAQESNYGRGGVEGDPIRAEVQDNSGFNNANMSTPADGGSPRMQMYLFDSKDAVVGEDYGISITAGDNTLLSSTQRASFGKGQFNITAEVVRVTDSVDEASDGCTTLENPNAILGKIAIINRGVCSFETKAAEAEKAGAIAAIIVNNRGTTEPAPVGADPDLDDPSIPTMGLSLNDGQKIYQMIEDGETVTVSMFDDKLYKGSSWDNGIVAHEWGHYISNRLVGNGNGLINNQGRSMGEGWGDFHALLLLSEESDLSIVGNDKLQKPYAATSYVSSFYSGIRNFPYSTDMDINPLTFKDVSASSPNVFQLENGSAEVHDAGEPWAAMLWDSFVGLVNDERHTYSEAKSRMMEYLVAGYKLTPIAPTYTEARDALLASALASDEEDYQVILKAFARRGMGIGAQSPARDDITHSNVVESFKTEGSSITGESHELNTNYEGLTVGYCTNDNVLDQGETGTVSFTVKNRGASSIEKLEATVEVVSDHDVTFSNEGKVVFENLSVLNNTTSKPLEFKIDRAGNGDNLTLRLQLPVEGEDTVAPEYFVDLPVNYDFKEKAVNNNSSVSGVNGFAGLKDFVETIYQGGDSAKGTSVTDDRFSFLFPWAEQDYLLINNNGFESDVALETKAFSVGFGGDFKISWDHYYEIEDGWDGGVVEISINNGEWVDVTEVGGTFEGTGYDGELRNLLPEREAFTGFASFPGGSESINFGTGLNGNQVKFRFRLVTDQNSNEFGWFIDNVSLTNITTSVFHDQVAGHTIACDNRLPNVVIKTSAGDVQEGESVTLTATAIDANAGDELTYSWKQTVGTEASISANNTPEITFTAPEVNEAVNQLTFELTVNDGTSDVVSTVDVKVRDIPAAVVTPTDNENRSSSGSLGWLALLLTPIAFLRRRKN
ncbi:GlyGly-CTERM sorting domain-containing protein [Parashewanella spongiae]|uniref:GlyGly-CTERM sorting domain-containing protein n=1 Tax=Parashewanella spongiae TaxID=342950 RepID=A0A3A6TT22_9GAMM|nr:rhombosortase-dependent M36 family metallopeptidase [Parashewanella spongiae]MCL1078862.1 rhombosortase-dependent M36 family metallopeptidase [Parashewanella spongiae]RJY11838.1 GlyGly-CTERM sorting domain-containing protein [Parashewanella spongiae]